jgi:hypothetical protein
MEVPRVDHDVAGVRVADKDGDVVMVGFGLGEGVVQDHVDLVVDALVRVQLRDDDPIPVAIEQMGEPDHDDVVVVDQRHPHWRVRRLHGSTVFTPRGVHNHPAR